MPLQAQTVAVKAGLAYPKWGGPAVSSAWESFRILQQHVRDNAIAGASAMSKSTAASKLSRRGRHAYVGMKTWRLDPAECESSTFILALLSRLREGFPYYQQTSYRRIRNLCLAIFCESHQRSTSFPVLNTLSTAFGTHAPHLPGSTSDLRHTVCIKKASTGSTAFAIRRNPAAPWTRLVPLIHQALTSQILVPRKDRVFLQQSFLPHIHAILSACPTLRTGSLSTRTPGTALTQQTQQCQQHSRKLLRSSSRATAAMALRTRAASSRQQELSRQSALLLMAERSPLQRRRALPVSLPTGPAATTSVTSLPLPQRAGQAWIMPALRGSP